MSATAPSLPASPLPVAVPQLPDFSERLSPMLVKELRQGMRSPVFVWGLIVMNLFLSVIVWLTMLMPEDESLHQAFFGAYCALVCGLLPLRAAGALHDELRGNTIDTLILTRLTGWRITLGKWVAVVAQQGLAAVTVLPYLIVRYFVGGVNLPMELAWLAIFLLAGMGSAAILTGFSWIKYFLFRAALMMGMTYLTGRFCKQVLEEIFGYHRNYRLDEIYQDVGWKGFLLLLIPALHLGFFALDVGASKVGSPVENRAVKRRLAGLAALACYTGIGLTWPVLPFLEHLVDLKHCVVLGGVTFLLLALQALLEKPVNLVSVVLPWVKRGWPGRLAGRFFYMGWPSGVMFLSVLLAGFIGAGWWWLAGRDVAVSSGSPSAYWTYLDVYSDSDYLVELVSDWGTVIGMIPVPLVLWQIFFRNRMPWHLGIYGLMLMIVGALQLGIVALAATMEKPNLLKWGLPIPTMSWAWIGESSDRDWTRASAGAFLSWSNLDIIAVSGIVIQVWWVLAVILAGRAFRETRAVEQEAAASLR